MHATPHVRSLLLLLAVAVSAGCAPSVSPLYRDYDHELSGSADPIVVDNEVEIYARLRAALEDAGWKEAPGPAPNALSTEPREFANWGLYRIVVSLDMVPMGDRHVRVHFHPARHYLFGGRSKIPYLGRSLRSALLPDLNAALEGHGFYPIGTPRERDEEHVEGT